MINLEFPVIFSFETPFALEFFYASSSQRPIAPTRKKKEQKGASVKVI